MNLFLAKGLKAIVILGYVKYVSNIKSIMFTSLKLAAGAAAAVDCAVLEVGW